MNRPLSSRDRYILAWAELLRYADLLHLKEQDVNLLEKKNEFTKEEFHDMREIARKMYENG